MTRQLPVGQGLLIHEVSRSHTMTKHIRYDSSELTYNLSRRAAAELRLRALAHTPAIPEPGPTPAPDTM